jgi:hypothetical protein
MGIERGGVPLKSRGVDVEATEIYRVGREALCFIASKLPAREFFVGAQRRGITCGIVFSPDEALQDEHYRARGTRSPSPTQSRIGRSPIPAFPSRDRRSHAVFGARRSSASPATRSFGTGLRLNNGISVPHDEPCRSVPRNGLLNKGWLVGQHELKELSHVLMH